jgi:hypothetical protein
MGWIYGTGGRGEGGTVGGETGGEGREQNSLSFFIFLVT